MWRNEDGASAAEYGILAAAIAAAIVVILLALGGMVRDMFGDSCTTIGTKTGVGSDCPK